jgi:hypothetical protein
MEGKSEQLGRKIVIAALSEAGVLPPAHFRFFARASMRQRLRLPDSSGGVSPMLAANRGLQLEESCRPTSRVGGMNATVGHFIM